MLPIHCHSFHSLSLSLSLPLSVSLSLQETKYDMGDCGRLISDIFFVHRFTANRGHLCVDMSAGSLTPPPSTPTPQWARVLCTSLVWECLWGRVRAGGGWRLPHPPTHPPTLKRFPACGWNIHDAAVVVATRNPAVSG